ncbi:M48 family metallopeptidase [Thiosulfativibrio zosterae]|uniref:YgjP-like metallopeptidase domain-containing protein n=1 Tax=Thiosulfativibrio zosterae TaxID=2675053 RepID=A0A6F8PKY0_9GAMM|nr:SprT family zinc-dependent metalloprotease [Thiosulfativibrio zosterae]BBP42759.1 hypothetical protein THMIRHAT_05050 [Thiosulfativibrio zosterae]
MHLLLPSNVVLSVRRTTRQDSVALKVTLDRNTLLVPKRFSDKKVQAFIQEQLTWIEQSIHKQRLRLPAPQLEAELNQVMRYGEVFHIEFEADINTCVWDDVSKLVFVPKTLQNQPGLVKNTLKKALLNDISQTLPAQTLRWAERMGVAKQLGNITIKNYKSRWGSCTHDGRVQFNWRLVFFAPEVIDYVIIHELAHLTHLNHSKAFWAEVARFCPNYKTHQATLKQQSRQAMAF